ncbi:MAG: hypothetical protein ACQEQF_01090 [Bacillota bacterium]
MKRYNTYQNIKKERIKYDTYLSSDISMEEIERLKYNFKSEQRAKWVAAARKIGELAAKGNKELREFIEDKLQYAVNIHQQQHAFAALGSYYGYCSYPNKEEFEILNQYKSEFEEGSYIQKKQTINLADFFDRIINHYNKYAKLTKIIDGELQPEKEDIKILKDILNSLVVSEDEEEIYDIQKRYIDNLKAENFILGQWEKHHFKTNKILNKIEERYVKSLEIDGWHLNSLIFVFDLIGKKRNNLDCFLHAFIRRSFKNNIYLLNLPFIFIKDYEENQSERYFSQFEYILDKIDEGKIKFNYRDHHFSHFYLDIIDYLNLLNIEKNKYYNLEFYINLPQKVSKKYNKLRSDKKKDEYEVRRMIEYAKSFFKENFAWKAQAEEVKNIFLVFDLLIKDLNNGLNIKEKILLILEEKDHWLNKNDRLIDGFVQELKFLYSKRLDNKENYVQEVEFQVYSVIDLVQNWNWSSLADKHIASIIINAFDILWFKGDKVERENFFKLFYTIFSEIPDGKIIEEMLEYCKNESLKEIIKIYLKAYRITDQDSEEFISYFKEVKKKILAEERIPEDLKELYSYIFSEKLSLNRKARDEEVNVFDIDRIIRLFGFKEESRLHDINVNEMYEFEALQKYILKPIFKYKFIVEGDFLFDLYGGYSSSRSEGKLIKELKTQVNLKSDRFIGQLKEIMDYLEFYKDDYFSAFKNEKDLSIIDDLGRKIIENLNEYQELVNQFSFLERDFIKTTILQAKSIIFEDSRYVSEISVALQSGNEDRLINILNKELGSWKINKRLRERYENIIYKYFLERGMFQEYNTQMIKGSSKFSPTRILAHFNNMIANYKMIFVFILAPFFVYLLGETFGLTKVKDMIVVFYLALSILVSIFLFVLSFLMIFVGLYKWFKNTKNEYFAEEIKEKSSLLENHLKYKVKFFLPKLFGVVFVVYLNFTLSDEMWTITHGVNIYLKAAIIVIFLVFIYYFIKSTQFESIRLTEKIKNKRTRSIMSIGLFYSFFGSILFNLMYGASMFKRNRGEITEVDINDIYTMEKLNNLIPIELEGIFENIKVILLNDIHILPELLVFWMVQMFFIAIILEFFLQKERIVKRN